MSFDVWAALDDEAPEQAAAPTTPPACSYCGGAEFDAPTDNGRVSRATCLACKGTMVSHDGVYWQPDLIGQPDNHPSPNADPDSGGVGGIGAAPVKIREEDLSSRTAANPHDGRVTWRQYLPGEDEHTDLDSHHPGWAHGVFEAHADRPDPIGRMEVSVGPDKVVVHETHVHQDYRRRGIGTALNRYMTQAFPGKEIDRGGATADGEEFRKSLGYARSSPRDRRKQLLAVSRSTGHERRVAGVDWCRHRHAEHCWLPRNDSHGGFALYSPQDRGRCPWPTPSTQQINCPMSEPGPMAGMERAGSKESTVDTEWGFHLTARWSDVRAKAKRIRAEGGVNVVSVLPDTVTGHVRGDTGVYESQINWVPGSRKVGFWQCGCAWASYAWGRSPAFRRYEGRMCSHALALQFEAQSWEMSGLPITEDVQRPGWMRDKVRVRHDRVTRDHDIRAASLRLDPEGVYPDGHGLDLAGAPIYAFAVVAYGQTGDPADAMRVLLASGIEHTAARAMLDTMPVVVAKKDEPPDEPTHAGVALKAADTGRVLMIQRSHKDESDPAAGTWEFPGGGREEGDHNSLMSAVREFEEEVGQPFPTGGHVSHVWQSPNGVYQGHVVVVPNESALDFSNGRATTNPDDPDGDDHEQSAWWDPDHARKNPALRPECKSSPWSHIKAAGLNKSAGIEIDAGFLDKVRQFMNDGEHADPGGPDWRANTPTDEVPDNRQTCDICGRPTEAYSHLHGKAYCAEHADEHLSQEPRPVRVHADYSAHDDLGGDADDYRPKAPPKGPDLGQEANPGSTGWATSGDPPEWDQSTNNPSIAPMTSWSVKRFGELHAPEPALPTTTGDEETEGERVRSRMSPEISDQQSDLTPNDGRTASIDDVVVRFQATAGAKVLAGPTSQGDQMDIASAARDYLAQNGGMAKTALKDFSADERAALIGEGRGARARNFGDLQIEGTHYADLRDAIARETTLDEATDDLFA